MSDTFYVNKNGGFLEELVMEIERRKVKEVREEKLDELLSKCTPENSHEEVDWGSPHIPKIGFKRLSEDAVIPSKAHPTDSGFDLVASEDVIVEPGETKIIPTGIAVELPPGYEATVRPRSGITAKTKLRVQLGTIDQDYRGEIGVIVDNISTDTWSNASRRIDNTYDDSTRDKSRGYIIRKGDRIAQLVIQPLPAVEAYEVEGDLKETDRGEGGFGSSGVRESE